MPVSNIIGREKEIELFDKLYQSKRSEFIAVYGRRRVGKTFLIKEIFGNDYAFHLTGLSRANTRGQLVNFHATMVRFAPGLADMTIPADWFSAFQLLIAYLESRTVDRKIVFIDELPWLDTPRSDFITVLEHFWNSWAFHRNDIMLIVCGSATSWMIDELINNHGGLHNRVTARMHLKPFTLSETERFLKAKGAAFDRYQITQLYMALGGIPFYLEDIDIAKSTAQNIDRMFFSSDGMLKNEFYNLYRSLFKKHEKHIAVIEQLAKKSGGISRKDLLKTTRLPNGGTFSKVLEELEQCGFIKKYIPFGKKNRDSLFRLTDPYSLFFLKFVKDSKATGTGIWLTQIDAPKWRAWSGYAFEYICFYHIDNIKKQLGIQGVYTEISAWRSKESADGTQIDLIIDRRDRVVNICEIKFSESIYSINKSYAENLRHKVATFRQETGTSKALFLTFVTTFGLKQNQYALGLVQSQVTMDALYEKT